MMVVMYKGKKMQLPCSSFAVSDTRAVFMRFASTIYYDHNHYKPLGDDWPQGKAHLATGAAYESHER